MTVQTTSNSRHVLLELARRHPSVFFPLARAWQWRGRNLNVELLTPETDLVVEGFFRSGNTYTAHAIQVASDDRLQLAYHTHAAATIKRAVKWRVPTLVLIRHPADAVTSNALKHPRVSIAQSLRAYTNFYRQVSPLSRHFVAARFEQATSDLNTVIERINSHFGTDIPPLSDDAQTQAELTRRMQGPSPERFAKDPGKSDLPSPEKEQGKAEIRAQLTSPPLKPLVDKAEHVYRDFLSATGQ